MQVTVKYRSWSCQDNQKLENNASIHYPTTTDLWYYVFISYNMKPHFLELMYLEPEDSDPIHTTPFSNENGTVLLRFQNDSRPH